MDVMQLQQDYFQRVVSLHPIVEADFELVKNATRFIARRFQKGFHQLGAAATGVNNPKKKRPYFGLQFDGKIGNVSRCAEYGAAYKAAEAGDRLRTIVAVRGDRDAAGKFYTHIVLPCCICREMLVQFSPECMVIIPWSDSPLEIKIAKVPIRTLYPMVYSERPRPKLNPAELWKDWARSMRNM